MSSDQFGPSEPIMLQDGTFEIISIKNGPAQLHVMVLPERYCSFRGVLKISQRRCDRRPYALHKQGERAAEIVGTHLYVGYDGMFVLGRANQRSEDATGMHLTYYGNSAWKAPVLHPKWLQLRIFGVLPQLIIVFFHMISYRSYLRLWIVLYCNAASLKIPGDANSCHHLQNSPHGPYSKWPDVFLQVFSKYLLKE